MSKITFADTVQIKDHETTIALKLNGLNGSVYGQTVPSLSGVKVIKGSSNRDYAINVFFIGLKQSYWFSEDLVEFINHSQGTIARVGKSTSAKNEDGTWQFVCETEPATDKFWNLFVNARIGENNIANFESQIDYLKVLTETDYVHRLYILN